MSFASLLINLCTVRRYTEGVVPDAYGNLPRTWGDHLTNQACRLMSGTGRGTAFAGVELKRDAEIVVADYISFMLDVDVTEQDRIIVDTIEYEIIMIIDVQDAAIVHHKEMALKTVR